MTSTQKPTNPLFTRQALVALLLPLIAEQALSVTIGLADTLMVSSVGEAAVSGVSLVDSFNTLMIQVMSALATGGAVVTSQYIGHREPKNAKAAAAQILFVLASFSLVVAAVVVVGRHAILRGIFGSIDADVMRYAETYFLLSALSYPFIGLYNAGAALFRAQGNSKISMLSSLVMNVINIGGNALLIYGLNWGVAGAATATLASRTVAGLMMMLLLRNRDNPIFLERLFHPEWNGGILKSILRVGVPNGLENGMFQFGKIALQSLVSTLGTASIAGYAVATNLVTFQYLPGVALGLGLITIVGQCVGAGEPEQAKAYTKKVIAVNYGLLLVICTCMAFFRSQVVGIYNLSPEASVLAQKLLLAHSCGMVLWPLAFALPNTLRAGLDAKFTMMVSVFSMWVFRIGMSYVLGAWLGMGLFGVWTAMQIDWAVRSLVFGVRFLGHKWEKARVLEG